MIKPNFITNGFVSGFVAGMFDFCRTEFGCTVAEFKERLTNTDFTARITEKVLETKAFMVKGCSPVEDVDTDEHPCGGVLDETSQYFDVPVYNGRDLYAKLIENYPKDHLQKIMYACSLMTLCQHAHFDTTDVYGLSLIIDALWDEYIGQYAFCRN